MESMRAVGYTMETAIADILDNSLSADARSIAINYSVEVAEPYLSILDNGVGISPEGARDAMRLAGIGSTAVRAETDLGRFGLGLKTASLSQCRRLTVVTRRDGITTGLVWDLDHIAATNEWSLLVLGDAEMRSEPRFDELDELEHGTLVVWKKFDRVVAQTKDLSAEFDVQMLRARDHLSLIFHQYLNGDHQFPKVAIAINGTPVRGFDPFLANAKGTQVSPEEPIEVEGISISVRSYTLPYLSRMTPEQRELALIPGSLRDSQGFYVYRGGRLVIWGTWFRLLPKSEGGKLARVKVDIPNSLDHLWSLDIKKSTAIPPVQVRDQLRRLATTLAAPSQNVVDYRGRKIKASDPVARVWDVIEDRDEYRYEINRGHPLMVRLTDQLDPAQISALECAFKMVESCFPSQDLMNKFAKDHVPAIGSSEQDELFRDTLLTIWRASEALLGGASEFVKWITTFEPWDRFRGDQESLINLISAADEAFPGGTT